MRAARQFKIAIIVWLSAMLMLGTFGCDAQNPKDKPSTEKQIWELSDIDEAILNENSGIVMRTEHESYPAGVNSLNVAITNNTNETVDFGEPYLIERRQSGQWYRANMDEIAWILIAYILAPSETQTHQINFDILKDPLSDGEYRIVKSIGGGLYSAHFTIPAAG